MSGSDEMNRHPTDETRDEAQKPQAGPDSSNPSPESGAEAKAKADAADEKGASTPPDRIGALEAEIETLRDQAMRARAEVENILRRTAREKQETSAYAVSGLARDLLSVPDNLRRALEALPAEARQDKLIKTFVDGVEMTERELLNAFERHGIRRIEPRGEKFDHNFHQAMAEVESHSQAPGTVVDVYQAGYVIRDRLLRPAMVTVAKAAPGPGADSAPDPSSPKGVDTTA
ncbi:protein GrpE [alpha proteobacterium Q-1]|nr:protein GrpE [alpha proteobacterium Q-1]